MFERDYLDYNGASFLANRIRAYWEARGLYPTTRIVKQYFVKRTEDKPMYVVRSDLAFDDHGFPYVKRSI